ncbi:Cyclic pyranopterin monophosphate synthase accessory protein 1 [Pseudobythopirellula maris]|uniref:Cyclic pyranopterin monophosphate synthase n=1 Tax=Pseudobythopirellula maris TaxID=2527991 RepID=A0A5C5ZMB5_9BACT|nr:cyclic pyranopterin monophosphate synthase MoaC [Pseudobythopirellula maris]TWT88592.1 Cyclic pyranopterin monophosphate synthase accessory protein 1 [Pseudobythopirellula maris]
MPPRLTHLDDHGACRMVDVGGKEPTARRAVATAVVRMASETLGLIRSGDAAKGDVLSAARLAGVMAAKKTADLIPLCHPLGLDAVQVDFHFQEPDALTIEACASVHARTGVEMEAMTAAAISALTVYDMVKAVDRGVVIEHVRLEAKSGGRSGDWRRDHAD